MLIRQFEGEYRFTKDTSPEKEIELREKIIDNLQKQASMIRYAQISRPLIYAEKTPEGGKVILRVNVYPTLIGKILRFIGLVR